MASNKPVIINGRPYDAVTGLPIEPIEVTNPDKTPIKKKPAPAPAKKPAPRTNRGVTNSEIVHQTSLQRSQTLSRRTAKKPAAPQKVVTKRAAPGRHMDIARSASVAKFAKDPEVKAPAPKPAAQATPTAKAPEKVAPRATAKPPTKPVKTPRADAPARVHPLAKRAAERADVKRKTMAAAAKPKTAKDIKEAEISKAVAATATPKPKTKAKTSAKTKRAALKQNKIFRRFVIIGAIVLALLAILYAVYRLVPSISVSMAASQAGISATYPEYTPDGYTLSHPVTYKDGEVDLKFTSNSNDNYYTITQARSSWDSSAVLDNIVEPTAGANYVTTKERGLTIYTYNSNAAWVNGGILYKVESKAPLSGDQIRRIATSL